MMKESEEWKNRKERKNEKEVTIVLEGRRGSSRQKYESDRDQSKLREKKRKRTWKCHQFKKKNSQMRGGVNWSVIKEGNKSME